VLHPTQLYEAILEGLVLFAILWIYTAKPRRGSRRRDSFCCSTGRFARSSNSCACRTRTWAITATVAWGWLTTGQVLSVPMILAGAALLVVAYRRNLPSGNYAPSGNHG